MSYFSHYYFILKNQAPLSLLSLITIFSIICIVLMLLRNSLSRKEKRKIRRLEKENLFFRKSINLFYKDDKDSAIKELRKLVKISPHSDEIYLEIARLLREKGKTTKAIRLNKSLLLKNRLDKNLRIRLLSELGINYRLLGNFNKAVQYFNQVIDLDRKNLKAYLQLGRLYKDLKDWNNAYNIQKTVLKMKGIKDTKELIYIKIEAGKDILSQGDRKGAIRYFKQALSLDKNCIYALISLGDVFFNQGRKRKALSLWKRVGEVDHNFLPLVSSKIERVFFELEKSDELELLYKSYLKKDPKNANLHLLLGKFFLRKNMLKQATGEFQKVIEINPHVTEAYACILKISTAESDRDYHVPFDVLKDKKNIYKCKECGFTSQEVFWKCPSCKRWDTILLSF